MLPVRLEWIPVLASGRLTIAPNTRLSCGLSGCMVVGKGCLQAGSGPMTEYRTGPHDVCGHQPRGKCGAMCGIAGYLDLRGDHPVDQEVLSAMTATLEHRGPDSAGRFTDPGIGLGFRRLSIIDLATGAQPITNEDGSVVLVCNGEIFNHRELRDGLTARGHTFRTGSDVEVLVHLYEERGTGLLDVIRGQFAFAIYDRARRRLFLARDHVGILPLFYARTAGHFVFGSENKTVLSHPAVPRAVDLAGLDQVLTFPGLVSPRTMFAGVHSLESGHYLLVQDGQVQKVRYWDLDYPELGEGPAERPEEFYVERLRGLLATSVQRRLLADVPVGFYLSGGLDSSLIGALVGEVSPHTRRHSFSIAFRDAGIDESPFQRLMAAKLSSVHHEEIFGVADAAESFRRMIRHAECPVKETYNTCSLSLSAAVRRAGVRVILTGEGADELFGGYPGYRFDQIDRTGLPYRRGVLDLLEAEARQHLWGDEKVFYERDYLAWSDTKLELYSAEAAAEFDTFECLALPLVDHEMLRNRHPLHQRSYLDFKLRLSDHLLADHGDRMGLANAVEARYPFLDLDVIDFARTLPPRLMVTPQGGEKHLLRQAAHGLVPTEIIQREKFGFRAPSSPWLLRQHPEWANDLLSHARIKRQGYFNPDTVERLKSQYLSADFDVHPHVGDDLLLVVLSFGVLLDEFDLPDHH
ncbi:asparagine synthase (glutamine-hydrolyzing) [Micromonospora sp. CB01531]|uniref:asparagine synthase (glutamine-hydrolyzing) n=1 Tax=Micromonospora sp. CB01531 TaxID=1718947 RepID=UPI0030828CDE